MVDARGGHRGPQAVTAFEHLFIYLLFFPLLTYISAQRSREVISLTLRSPTRAVTPCKRFLRSSYPGKRNAGVTKLIISF